MVQTRRVANQAREGEAGSAWHLRARRCKSASRARNHECRFVSGRRLVPQFPSRNQVTRQFRKEKFLALARLPPPGRIKFRIACTADAQGDARGECPLVNESRAARMVVGGHHQDALPSTGLDKPRDFGRLVPRVLRPVREFHNRFGGHAKRFEVVLHHLRHAEILTQHPAARHDHGRNSFAVQFRGMEGAVRRVVIIAEDDECVGLRGRLIHYPGLPGKAQQRMPGNVEKCEESEKKEKGQQSKKNSALFAASHAMGSNLRNRSAASSGMIAL